MDCIPVITNNCWVREFFAIRRRELPQLGICSREASHQSCRTHLVLPLLSQMDQLKSFHILTVGNAPQMVQNLWNRIADGGGHLISHIAHPSFDRNSWPETLRSHPVYFFRDDIRMPIQPGNREFLASLERDGVPTIHNMILSDRVVSKLPYEEALAYAGLLAERLFSIYETVKPTVVVGGFDALHGSLALAVARHMG